MARSLTNRLMSFFLGPVEEEYDGFYEEADADLGDPAPEQHMPEPSPAATRRGGLFTRRDENNLVELTQAPPRVVIQHPRNYSEAQNLCQVLKDRSLLIVEFKDTEEKDRGQLICFLSGVVSALDGTGEQINELTYAFAPRHFTVEADAARGTVSAGTIPRYRMPD